MFNTDNGYLSYCDSRNNLFYNMKTILEWLNEAKEQGYDWAEAAIKNCIHEWSDTNPPYTVEKESLIHALSSAFNWGKSPQKYAYWKVVYEKLRTAEEGDSTLIEYLIEDLGRLNSALKNLEYITDLKEPYRTKVYDATKTSYEEQLAEVKAEIAKRLGIKPQKERKLIGWVMQNEDGGYSKYIPPSFIKGDGGWFMHGVANWSDITPEQAADLCDRLPKWSDDEPTPVYE